MTRRAAPKLHIGELLLWAAAVLAGAFVLVPAVVEFVQARQLEAAEAERDLAGRERVLNTMRDLDQVTQDPMTAERLRETPDPDLRTFLHEPVADVDHANDPPDEAHD